MDYRKRFLARGKNLKLSDFDPNDTAGLTDQNAADEKARENTELLANLQQKLYASHNHALLIVLQAMDAGGKDGTIRHVMSGVNPQGCSVTSFKQPSAKELGHDFLWRVHKAVPAKGNIGIFNRSHYEDVLVVRVHKIVPREIWEQRYEQIRDFEKMLFRNDTIILKFYLNISKDEQEKRFEQRLDDPNKNWKFSPSDRQERKFWDAYQEAYEEALRRTSRKHAPWYAIPSNHKWFRNLAVSQIIVDTLEDLHLQYPKPQSRQAIEVGTKKP